MPLTRERTQIPLITTLGFRSKRSSAELKGSTVFQHLHSYLQERGNRLGQHPVLPEETSQMKEETLHLATDWRSSRYSLNKPMGAISTMSIPIFEKTSWEKNTENTITKVKLRGKVNRALNAIHS